MAKKDLIRRVNEALEERSYPLRLAPATVSEIETALEKQTGFRVAARVLRNSDAVFILEGSVHGYPARLRVHLDAMKMISVHDLSNLLAEHARAGRGRYPFRRQQRTEMFTAKTVESFSEAVAAFVKKWSWPEATLHKKPQ